jgi:hypothetical protein
VKFVVITTTEVEAPTVNEVLTNLPAGRIIKQHILQKYDRYRPKPGNELKAILLKFGLKPGPRCLCGRHMFTMNKNGVEWCRRNLDVIAGWLKVEAQRAKLPFNEWAAKVLIRRAISNSIRKAEYAEIHHL